MKEFVKAVASIAKKNAIKVLKINLDSGKYNVIYLKKGEYKSDSPYLDDWIDECINKGIIKQDYIGSFKKLLNLENLRETLKTKDYVHLKFERRFNPNTDKWKINIITVVLNPKEKEECYLIVYNIDN